MSASPEARLHGVRESSVKGFYKDRIARRIKAGIPGPVKAGLRREIDRAREAGGYFVRPPNDKGAHNSVDPRLVREYNKTRPLGPKRLMCYLPFTSGHFCAGGRTLACIYT